jgi:hypothetical protein
MSILPRLVRRVDEEGIGLQLERTVMARITSQKQRLVILYDANAGPTVYQIAVDIAGKAWDAGSTVRVRRFGERRELNTFPFQAIAPGPLAQIEDVPEAIPEDLDLASVTLVVSSPMTLHSTRSSAESAA